MYCSHCGSTISDELNYCKNCGARNQRSSVPYEDRVRGVALSAAAFIGVTGLVGFYFVMRELLRSPVATPGSTFFIMVAYVFALVMMFSIFIRMAKSDSSTPRRRDFSESVPSYLRPATTAQLNEPRDAPASVTDHTTRTLSEFENQLRK